jgi:hypothetical protein
MTSPHPSSSTRGLEVIESFDGSAGELLDWYRSKRAERVSLTMVQQA